jgi:hypothetical protein
MLVVVSLLDQQAYRPNMADNLDSQACIVQNEADRTDNGPRPHERTKIMRLLIETSTVQFRVAGLPKRKIVKGQEATTRDGRPVWTVRQGNHLGRGGR